MGMKMKINELEEPIMRCWSVVEDIRDLSRLMDLREISEDELGNYLLGLSSIYQAKFELLFDYFEAAIKDVAKYRSDERRERVLQELCNSLDDEPDTLPIEDEL
jgi:hypothetical protein